MPDTTRLFANWSRYNRLFNEQLYATCASVSDAERKHDLGAFFGSVHATLNNCSQALSDA